MARWARHETSEVSRCIRAGGAKRGRPRRSGGCLPPNPRAHGKIRAEFRPVRFQRTSSAKRRNPHRGGRIVVGARHSPRDLSHGGHCAMAQASICNRPQGMPRPYMRHVIATDREIDRLVYELYGLTDEEIAIVEGHAGQGFGSRKTRRATKDAKGFSWLSSFFRGFRVPKSYASRICRRSPILCVFLVSLCLGGEISAVESGAHAPAIWYASFSATSVRSSVSCQPSIAIHTWPRPSRAPAGRLRLTSASGAS